MRGSANERPVCRTDAGVTEDVNTFAIAIEAVLTAQGQSSVIRRDPRTRPRPARLRKPLTMFAEERPAGLEVLASAGG